MNPLESTIATHPFFAGLPPEAVSKLAGCAMETKFEAGEAIFKEGDPANRFYLILEGRVVLETTKTGATSEVQTIGAGDVLGWSWLFPPYLWNFDARALEKTRAVFFYGTRLREYAEEDHTLGFELMKRFARVMIQRLQATRRRLVELSASDRAGRQGQAP